MTHYFAGFFFKMSKIENKMCTNKSLVELKTRGLEQNLSCFLNTKIKGNDDR